MTFVINVTAQVRKLKSENQLSLKTPLALLHVYTQNQAWADAIALHDQLIRGITQAITVVYGVDERPEAELKMIHDEWHGKVVIK